MSVLSVQFAKRTETEKDKKCLWSFSNSGVGGDGKFSVGGGGGKIFKIKKGVFGPIGGRIK